MGGVTFFMVGFGAGIITGWYLKERFKNVKLLAIEERINSEQRDMYKIKSAVSNG